MVLLLSDKNKKSSQAVCFRSDFDNVVFFGIFKSKIKGRAFVLKLLLLITFIFLQTSAFGEEVANKISPKTMQCLGCHKTATPGIVRDWENSLHSKVTPAEALKKPELERRFSAEKVNDELEKYVVGCYECHGLNGDKHKDNFTHFGNKINVIVSPNDCNTCHPAEVSEFVGSKKYHAIRNLLENPVYKSLVNSITGIKSYHNGVLSQKGPSESTLHETCLGCHGTDVYVKGFKKIKSSMGGIEITVPDLTNWPNMGVGRKNPDGSYGACTACHPRHSFSIEIARMPYTCGQCHLEPDVPAYNVYKESKHGNIFYSLGQKNWNFKAVPWKVGVDFTAPTCATCHTSLITTPDGKIVAKRTHDFGARLWVRIFGLIYSHPQPKSGDATIIRNDDGLPLPTTFTGKAASKFLIDEKEMDKRKEVVTNICSSCHNTDWIKGHFNKFERTVKETDEMVKTATLMLVDAWDRKLADKSNPFDETIERKWIKQWLFYANTIRYASAMTGAPDYTSFKYGWWELTTNLKEIHEHMKIKDGIKK